MVASLLEKTVTSVVKSSGTKYREDGGSILLQICVPGCLRHWRLFHVCHCIHIYSNWLAEQFCCLSSNMLYILSLQ
jgi:hypothetical protein